jgi:integrase/recombinase XerD
LGFLAHLRSKKYKQASLAHVFAAMSAFYDYLQDAGQVDHNPVQPIIRRYLKPYKAGIDRDERRCISNDELVKLINTTLSSRNQALWVLAAKTGMRRHEMAALDVRDVDMIEKTVILKPTGKRTNRTLFFDDETARILQRWLEARAAMGYKDGPLFVTSTGRLNPKSIYRLMMIHSREIGISDPKIGKDHISPHYLRIWFTTMLLRAGMSREYVMALRGDSGGPVDIYNRIEKEDLRRSYLVHIPTLGI